MRRTRNLEEPKKNRRRDRRRLATIHAYGSLISLALGASRQLDLAWTGLPLLILAAQLPARSPFKVLPQLISKHHLISYAISLLIFVWITNFLACAVDHWV